MGHIPYGYIIRNGKALVDDLVADQVRVLFRSYLSGLSLTDASKQAGINRCHSSVANMLTDTRYVKDSFYPPIIEGSIFDKAQKEKQHRVEMLGRTGRQKILAKGIALQRFHAHVTELLYEDPFKQAEYAYTLIKGEEITNGE